LNEGVGVMKQINSYIDAVLTKEIINYLDYCIRLAENGALIVCDNVLERGL